MFAKYPVQPLQQDFDVGQRPLHSIATESMAGLPEKNFADAPRGQEKVTVAVGVAYLELLESSPGESCQRAFF